MVQQIREVTLHSSQKKLEHGRERTKLPIVGPIAIAAMAILYTSSANSMHIDGSDARNLIVVNIQGNSEACNIEKKSCNVHTQISVEQFSHLNSCYNYTVLILFTQMS